MNNSPHLYPLRFKPILKSKIWGGDKLKIQLNKHSDKSYIGESWEVSGVTDDVSVVAEGELKGQNLQDILQCYKGQLVGQKVYAQFKDEFPLLIKFIDAADTLSVQLHPDDALAKKRHNSFGKTEMWYVVESEPDGFIIADFINQLTADDLTSYIEKGNLQNQLKSYSVQPGDSFFITPGMVHAIGKGVLLAEIQQTSDITYRLYDWDRKDKQGNGRQLHIDESIEAIDYSLTAKPKIEYNTNKDKALLADSKYFTTNRIHINESFKLDLKERDSFTILMGIDGNIQVDYNGSIYSINRGQTLLIPACLNEVALLTQKQGLILDIYINK